MSEKKETFKSIRWHVVRRYEYGKGHGEVTGMRGYCDDNRYELSQNKDGEWEALIVVVIDNDNWTFRSVAKGANILEVIHQTEEYAYRISEQAEIDAALAYDDSNYDDDSRADDGH